MKFDIIKKLIIEMDYYAGLEYFENAKDTLNKIREELKKKTVSNVSFEELVGDKERDEITLKNIHDILVNNNIRLNPSNYNISDWLNLLLKLDRRKDELKGGMYSDIDKHRKIVAEEMLCLEMAVFVKSSKDKKPNRRFLDIAYNIHPDLSCKELKRRETTKLWKAIEKNDKIAIDKAKYEIIKYNK